MPYNVSLGTIRPFSDADTIVYEDAVNHTAKQLSDIWYLQVFPNVRDSPPNLEPLVSLPAHAEETSGLESSSLSDFLENTTVEHEHALPPTEKMSVEPNSLEFYEQLIKALELDTPSYAHVPSTIIEEFKALLRKYPHVFHLPNSPLSTIKGFHHDINAGENLPRLVNIEKVVVVPEVSSSDIRIPDDAPNAPEIEIIAEQPRISANPDLVSVAFEIGKYLETLPNKSAVSSQACKFVYEHFPAAREILARHGRLRGLVKSCPYLQIEGGMHGGTYVLSLNLEVFSRICRL